MNYLELLAVGIVVGSGLVLGGVATYSFINLVHTLYDELWAKPRWIKKMARIEAECEAIMYNDGDGWHEA